MIAMVSNKRRWLYRYVDFVGLMEVDLCPLESDNWTGPSGWRMMVSKMVGATKEHALCSSSYNSGWWCVDGHT